MKETCAENIVKKCEESSKISCEGLKKRVNVSEAKSNIYLNLMNDEINMNFF